MPIPIIVGAIFFIVGAGSFFAALFASGGWDRSKQFRVLGELWRGEHGPGRRRAARLGLLAVLVGAVVSMCGVAANDRERARRCEAHCAASGAVGTIGPSSQPHPTHRRAAAFVACICEGPDGARQESRADDLMAP